VDLIVVNITN